MREISKYKKRQIVVASEIGLALGVALFFVFWVVTNNWASLVIIPVAVIMAAAQALATREDDGKQ
jgi:hypothetical protein